MVLKLILRHTSVSQTDPVIWWMFCESRVRGLTDSPEAVLSFRALVGVWARWEKHVSVEAAAWLSFHLCMLNQSQQLSLCVGWSVADSCHIWKWRSFSFHPSCCHIWLHIYSSVLLPCHKLTSDKPHVTYTLAFVSFFPSFCYLLSLSVLSALVWLILHSCSTVSASDFFPPSKP